MAEPDQAKDHLMKALAAALEPIAREALERVDEKPSEKDALAWANAIEQAIVAGARLGLAEAAAQVDEALPDAHVVLRMDLEATDMWAERYG
jgi:hypothetical protein